MSTRTDFQAPWSTGLRLITAASLLMLLTIAVLGVVVGPREMWFWWLAMVVLPASIALIGGLFAVTGYRIDGAELLIRRPLWTTRLALDGLVSVDVDPKAMQWSMRSFGNGGLFVYAGWFRNRQLGAYRAWATDPANSVVLRFPQRTVVVTPGQPREFVDSLRRQRRLRTD